LIPGWQALPYLCPVRIWVGNSSSACATIAGRENSHGRLSSDLLIVTKKAMNVSVPSPSYLPRGFKRQGLCHHHNYITPHCQCKPIELTWILTLFQEVLKSSMSPLVMSQLQCPARCSSPKTVMLSASIPSSIQGPARRTDGCGKGRPDHWRIAWHRPRDSLAFRARRRIFDDRRA
jgi:hypothetical protein